MYDVSNYYTYYLSCHILIDKVITCGLLMFLNVSSFLELL